MVDETEFEIMDVDHDLRLNDIGAETDTAYCPKCEEEYILPEDTEICPVCGSDRIGFV